MLDSGLVAFIDRRYIPKIMSDPATLKTTALFAAHQKLGARLVDFGGWHMPVQYSGIIEEHKAVREAAGVFDISHMGEFFVCGGETFLGNVGDKRLPEALLQRSADQ